MELSQIEKAAQFIFMWIGFGTVVGLSAKAIMPGRDPGGSIATLMMGIVGTVVGCGLVKFFWPELHVSPISVLGFCVGTGGAFIILTSYKILGGYWFVEGEQMSHWHVRRLLGGRRRLRQAHYED